MNAKDILINRIEQRVKKLPWDQLKCDKCYVGGNSLNRLTPNDYDLFPFGDSNIETGNLEELFESKNAKTVSGNGFTIQICNYRKNNLKELVDSFDFAHIQIGAVIIRSSKGNVSIEQLYYSPAYTTSKITESTFFTGSDYPLSSLMRMFKYKDRGDFAGKSFMFEALSVLAAITKRGFSSYDDFKDQLDAVDLGLLPEDFKNVSTEILSDLFKSMNTDKNCDISF